MVMAVIGFLISVSIPLGINYVGMEFNYIAGYIENQRSYQGKCSRL